MRHVWFYSSSLCLLLTQLPLVSSRALQRAPDICNPSRQICLDPNTVESFQDIESISISRRAGGGGGRGPKDKGPNLHGGSGGGGPPPEVPGGTGTGGFTTGESTGGFQTEESTGGFQSPGEQQSGGSVSQSTGGDRPAGGNSKPEPQNVAQVTSLTAAKEAELRSRGEKGIQLVESPAKSQDFTEQLGNYEFNGERFHLQEGDIEGVVQVMGLETKYNFELDQAHWSSWTIESKTSVGDARFIASVSFGRSPGANSEEYLAFVAHDRYAKYDDNRYMHDEEGKRLKDPSGNLIEQPNKETKSVPVAQLVYEAAKRSEKLTPAKKIFMISDNVENEEGQKILSELHTAFGKGESAVWQKDATGQEGEVFKILSGLDTNYSFLNTVGRNPDFFQDYDLISITTYTKPLLRMNMEFSKKG